jgi:hypothetical protein
MIGMEMLVAALAIGAIVFFAFFFFGTMKQHKRSTETVLQKFIIRNIDPQHPYTFEAVGEEVSADLGWDSENRQFITKHGYGGVIGQIMDSYVPYKMYNEDEEEEYLFLSSARLDTTQSFVNRESAKRGVVECDALMSLESSMGGLTIVSYAWDFSSKNFVKIDELRRLTRGQFHNNLINTGLSIRPLVAALRNTRLISDRIATESEAAKIALRSLTETASERNLYRLLLSRPELEGAPQEVIFRGTRGVLIWYLTISLIITVISSLLAGPLGLLAFPISFLGVFFFDRVMGIFPRSREL